MNTIVLDETNLHIIGLEKVYTRESAHLKTYDGKEVIGLNLPDEVIYQGKKYRVTNLGTNCFCDCTKLEKIKLNDNIYSIGKNCFKDCTSLKEINIPARLEEIKGNAFENCTSLENFEVPKNVIIRKDAFKNCNIDQLAPLDTLLERNKSFKNINKIYKDNEDREER